MERFSKTDAIALVGIFISVIGERKGASITTAANQWHDALRFYRPELVEQAWREYRDGPRSSFWPTPGEIIALMRANMPPPGHVPLIEPPREFVRDGRTVAEEIAHRAAFCLQMRKQYPAAFSGNYVAPEREPRPASDGGLTPALIELTKRQGIYRPAPTPNQQDSK